MQEIRPGGRSMFRIAVSVFCAVTMAGPLAAIVPRAISAPHALPADMGVLRLSVRSQIQLAAPLYLWFLRDGGSPDHDADLLMFKRGVGMALMGGNMIDSRPQMVVVLPGRYKLVAFSVSCAVLPPPNSYCFPKGMKMPTGRYATPPAEFEVERGHMTDAGEFVLEFPPAMDVGGADTYRDAVSSQLMMSIRWRRIAETMPPKFAKMRAGSPPTADPAMMSNIQCEARPEGAKGAGQYYPFKC
jgi:hypothetical protein